MDEDEPTGYRPISEATRDRSWRVKLRDGRTLLVSWDFRDVPMPWDSARRRRVWGWCHRDDREPIDEEEIEGYIDPAERL